MKKFSLIFLSFILIFFLFSCKSHTPNIISQGTFPEFYKVGHRGTRGLMPENTIPSMKKAIDHGANFLEVDVQISKDNQVVVSHDPHINRKFSLLPNGDEIPEEESKKYLIHQLDYSEIRKFDVGLKYHEDFPQQQKMKAFIPLLGELIDSVETYVSDNNLQSINYNIEIKANPSKDGEYQPQPEEYIKLVMDVLKNKSIKNRYYIQSFDIRQIQEVREKYPEVNVGFLTGNKGATFEENIAELGFYPDIYSPQYHITSKELIEKCHDKEIKLVPWTVNSKKNMKMLIKLGVDGIITDFPNRLNEIN